MEPIRILHNVRDVSIGGIAMMLMNIYRVIDRDKVQFDFITDKRKYALEDEIEALGGKVHKIPYTFKKYFSTKTAFKKIIRANPEYKILHMHMPNNWNAVFLPLAKKNGLKTIVHSHNTFFASFSIKTLKSLVVKIINKADYRFACSLAAGKYLFGNEAVNQQNFVFFPNAIDVKEYAFDREKRKEIRSELGIDDKHFVIGHVGRFSAQKNHEFLISIFEKVHGKNPDSILLLVGDGSLRHKQEERLKSLNLKDRVIFTGRRFDVNRLVQAMDVFVLPSLHEGFPVTAVEAQASGLKTILSDKITAEVKITDLVEYLPLEDSLDIWADKILSAYEYERTGYAEKVIKAGYDVKETAKWLENFYLEIQARKNENV
jgi:glycosyltransferase involved in cell wall biosynthesis